MNKIKVLPDNLANQIAAGEVVERPASVIKELVENAIDAGGMRLTIDVELGGRRLMRVSDDGEGMSRDDAILAFERHATSKISSSDDLGRIGTLGFRGEALASIASVGKVELLTKIEGETTATLVTIEGGRLLDVRDSARDRGTTIAIRDLFFNTPARRKFMRSEATENYHLTSIVTHYALAHPEIAITLTNNGREVLRVSPAKDLRERSFQVFGGGLVESLLPVEGGRDFVARVTGYISAPRERRTTRDAQYFFVNKRFVRDKTIAGGLLEGYRSVLPHGVYPVAFLFIDIPLEEIDVNVHPAKTEIRFRRGEAVKDVIAEAIRHTLARAGITGDMKPEEFLTSTARSNDHTTVPGLDVEQYRQPTASISVAIPEAIDLQNEIRFDESMAGGIEVETSGKPEKRITTEAEDPFPSSDNAAKEIVETPYELGDLPPLNSAAKYARAAEIESIVSAKITPLGQMHDSFIVAVDDEGLLLIDQHVAHERILFDKYRKSEGDRPIESQNLLLPETLDLSPPQSEAFRLIEDDLESLGFGVMRLSGRTVAIKCIPTDLPPNEARNLFAEILDTIDAEKRGAPKSTLRDDLAASLACRAAIKINMKLTPEKMSWLIDRLLATSSPTTCPHGRPVILRLSVKDIERGFHRT
ncbi:MAG: DNA mismatch repair endonuclease MutL [Pyrinomonadaceae bacterium]